MKIVLAPDSFKGSLSAKEVCAAMEEGIRRVAADAFVVPVPMADGGEGTVQSLVDATGGHIHTATVTGPLGAPVVAQYGILGDGVTAVIEMAEAAGLNLVDKTMRNPLVTTTYGFGELIRHALDRGCRKFILGIGGSATNDAGAGMAQALGASLLDEHNVALGRGGGELRRLHHIDLSGMDSRVAESEFAVACDVDNPLCGEHGASAVFGPQKGATKEQIQWLDDSLLRFAQVVREELHLDILDTPGSGAAGGLGAGSIAFLGAKLESGVNIVIAATNLSQKMQGASVVLCGEGQSDFQTARGKTPMGVARVASEQGIPVILLVGSIGKGVEALYPFGVRSIFSIVDGPMTLEEATSRAHDLVAGAAERVMRLIV